MRTRLHAPRSRGRRIALLAGSLVTLALAVFGTVGLVGATIGGGPAAGFTPNPGKISKAPGPTHAGQKGAATCDEPGQPACPTPSAGWTPIASDSPAAVLATLPSLPGYMTPMEASSLPASDSYSFDTPVLVLPATTVKAATQGDDEYDNLPHFVIRASVNGIRGVTYDLVYNPTIHELRISSVGGMQSPNDPAYNKPFPWKGVSASTAMATLRNARGLALAAGTQPQLVFFVLNPAAMNPAHPIKWFGGGESPEDAIWRLKGSDGQLYFVGVDGHLYLPKDLPAVPGAAFNQP